MNAELLEVAEDAARAAGSLLAERFRDVGALVVHSKSTPTDVASDADLAAEQAIRELLAARRPDDALLAEEGGGETASPPAGALRWVVDPLDGTVNFLFGIPQWCVSVACEDAEGPVAGVILDPLRDECFTVARDGTPRLNGEEITAAPPRPLERALVATGFAYDSEVRRVQAETVAALLPRARDVRRMGSAALDLAWLAAGRYDAYYERGGQPWDWMAGTLLCERAGLVVHDLPDREGLPHGICAGRPELLDVLEREFAL